MMRIGFNIAMFFFLRMKPGNCDLFKFILEKVNIKFVGYYGNAKWNYNVPVNHNGRTFSFPLSTIQPSSCNKISLMMVSSILDD